jgi:2-(1,2-epoxy-1,2-dihydrophenyl)acetyl-CoA isomerase
VTAVTSPDGVAIEGQGGVLRITLDRPSRKNSLDVAAVRRIVAALEAAATDDALRVVVLSAAGADFCAGADWVASNAAAARPRTGNLQRRVPLQAHRLIELLTTIQLPVVCSVRGWAAGLGFQLALAADFTIAAESACFWEPYLERGFSADSSPVPRRRRGGSSTAPCPKTSSWQRPRRSWNSSPAQPPLP